MKNTTKALILRTYKKDDNCLMVHCYTELYGKQTFVLSSNYGRASQKAKALYFPLSILKIEFTPFRANSLPRITEAAPQPLLHSLLNDFSKTSIAIFISELLSKSIKIQEPDENLFQYLTNSIELFENIDAGFESFHILFLIKFTRFLGIEPRNNFSTVFPFFNFIKGEFVSSQEIGTAPPKMSKMLHFLFSQNMSAADEITVSHAQRAMLLKGLIYYYQCHIPDFGEMKTLKVYGEMFGL